MRGLNHVRLEGRVAGRPRVRKPNNARPWIEFRLEVTRSWKDRKTKQHRSDTQTHCVVANGEVARTIHREIDTGAEVLVFGALQTRKWRVENTNHYRAEVHAREVIHTAGTTPRTGANPRNPPAQDGAPPTQASTATQDQAPRREEPPPIDGEEALQRYGW